MTDTRLDPSTRGIRSLPPVAIPLLVGAGVSVALGVYARTHDPTGRNLFSLFFSNTLTLKAWLGTGSLALATTQPLTRRWLPRGDLHRLIGTIAFAMSLPVAFHCLWALGYQGQTTRVAVHSLAGCAFYGAFAAKITTARRSDQPAWAVPLAGALTLSLVVVVWWTSALWYFDNVTWSP